MYPCVPIDRYLAHEAIEGLPSALGLIFPPDLTEEDFEELLVIKELTTPIPLIALFSTPFPKILLSSLTKLACFGIEVLRLEGNFSLLQIQEIHNYIEEHRLGMSVVLQ